jgi:hypothetical protein
MRPSEQVKRLGRHSCRTRLVLVARQQRQWDPTRNARSHRWRDTLLASRRGPRRCGLVEAVASAHAERNEAASEPAELSARLSRSSMHSQASCKSGSDSAGSQWIWNPSGKCAELKKMGAPETVTLGSTFSSCARNRASASVRCSSSLAIREAFMPPNAALSRRRPAAVGDTKDFPGGRLERIVRCCGR